MEIPPSLTGVHSSDNLMRGNDTKYDKAKQRGRESFLIARRDEMPIGSVSQRTPGDGSKEKTLPLVLLDFGEAENAPGAFSDSRRMGLDAEAFSVRCEYCPV